MTEPPPSGEGAQIDWADYDDLTYDAFRRRAVDPTLTDTEKIGFPPALRDGAEGRILDAITGPLRLTSSRGLRVCDIGCGCGLLARKLVDVCGVQGHELHLVDSPEMLEQLPDEPHVRKLPGRFPGVACPEGRFDAVLAYSVLHHIFAEASVFAFVD